MIKNNLLGGTDFATPTTRIKPTDLNDTNNAIIRAGAKGVAQVPFTTLKATGDWVNEGYLGADRFTTAAGVNGTYGTGTAFFKTDKYILNITDTAGADTTHNPDAMDDPENAFDNNNSTRAEKEIAGGSPTTHLGKTFTSRTINVIKVIAQITTNTSANNSMRLQSFDGSVWSDIVEFYSKHTTNSGKVVYICTSPITTQGIRVRLSSTGGGTQFKHYVYTLEYGDYNTSDTVIADQNTLTLNGDETLISVYSQLANSTEISATLNNNNVVQEEQANTDYRSAGVKCVATEDIIITNATKTTNTIGDVKIRDYVGTMSTFGTYFKKGETFFITVHSPSLAAKRIDFATTGTNQFTFPIQREGFKIISSGGSIASDEFDFTGTTQLFAIATIESRVSNGNVVTNIKCQLSDETKTISAVHTLSANQTTSIPITTPPTADDVLKMTFTLETTNTTITPVFTGYGVSKN